MEWKRTGQYASVADVILKKSGQTIDEIINPKTVHPSELHNITTAVEIIQTAIEKDLPITIIGDYDADGITATAILTLTLKHLNSKVLPIIPKRFTEGYGIPTRAITTAETGLIITVDNGIKAIDEIYLAKSLNQQVIIIDHHIPGDELPIADIIVDPHIEPEKNAFIHYCGAGLAFKLSELILEGKGVSKKLLNSLNVLACIGTISDVMDLTGDNRRIIMDGLRIMNEDLDTLPYGIKHLIMCAGKNGIDEDSIGYKIGPVINAPGRLYNAGGTSVLKALLNDSQADAISYTKKMLEINDQRKDIVNKWYSQINDELTGRKKAVIVSYVQDMPEGIVGVVAGKLANEHRVPVFIFTDSSEDEVLKGSGRSYGDIDLYSVITHVSEITEKAGGHEGAAGLSVHREKFNLLKETIEDFIKTLPDPAEESLLYDLELSPDEVGQALAEIKRFAPFGAGIPKPVVVVKEYKAIGKNGSHFRLMGTGKEHLKIFGCNFDAVAFNLAPLYITMNCPIRMDMLGTIGENTYNGKTSIQIIVSDIKATE